VLDHVLSSFQKDDLRPITWGCNFRWLLGNMMFVEGLWECYCHDRKSWGGVGGMRSMGEGLA